MTNKLIEQARDQGDARALASDLSATLRQLDRLEKRTTVDARSAVALATMLINLESIRRALPKLPKTVAPEVRAFYQAELKTLDEGVSQALRQYITSTGDHRPSTLGLQGFAHRVLTDWKKDQDAAAARKATRPAAQKPVAPKPAVRPARKSRAGRCIECRKQVDYITTSGMCSPCLDKWTSRRRR